MSPSPTFESQLADFTHYANENFPLSSLVSVSSPVDSSGSVVPGIGNIWKGGDPFGIGGKIQEQTQKNIANDPVASTLAGFFSGQLSRVIILILGFVLIAGGVFMLKPSLAPEAIKGALPK